VADDVRPLDPEPVHEEPAMLCMVGQPEWPFDWPRASEPGAVVVEQAVAVGEGRLLQERLSPRRADTPVDQHDGFSRSSKLVLEPETIDRRPIHLAHDLTHRS
jgi:hypothetical protein